MNVFLDTNVVIDFMGKREGFFKDQQLDVSDSEFFIVFLGSFINIPYLCGK